MLGLSIDSFQVQRSRCVGRKWLEGINLSSRSLRPTHVLVLRRMLVPETGNGNVHCVPKGGKGRCQEVTRVVRVCPTVMRSAVRLLRSSTRTPPVAEGAGGEATWTTLRS